MDGSRCSLVPSPQPIASHAQIYESEQYEVVKRQVVSHFVPLHACQVNGGIPLLVQAGDLSAGHRYTTARVIAGRMMVSRRASLGVPAPGGRMVS